MQSTTFRVVPGRDGTRAVSPANMADAAAFSYSATVLVAAFGQLGVVTFSGPR